ncbi:hypothetical protein P3S67_008394 [Capsicum chacoense]
MNLDLSNEEDEHRRSAKLNRAFQKMNKMVIILDDIWKRLSLEKLGSPLGVEGCRLILTSRSSEVCQKMGCKELLEVKKLNTDDAWELFRKSLGSESQLSPDIERVAQSMAIRCEGLPLGLITLAGSMKGVTDIREWNNALNEFPDDMENDVFKISKCHGLSSCFVNNFLSRTTSLRGLTCRIYDCDEIEWIVNVPSGRDTTTDPHCIHFHSLKVEWLQNLVGLCKGKITSHTFSGHRMKKLFPRAILQDLKNLEMLDVLGCSEMEEIIGREEGEGSSLSSSSSTSTTAHLPKLKQLILRELKSICEGKLMCDSVEWMEFRKCPKLKRMPFYTANEHPFPSLRYIQVDE